MATLTYTLTEAITLNGQDHGGSMTKTISGIDNVFKSIFACTDGNTGGTDGSTTIIAQFNATSSGNDADATAFDTTHVEYIRISNLDSTNAVYLQFQGASDWYVVKLQAGHHYCMGSPDDVMLATDDSTTIAHASWEDLAVISVRNEAAATVNVELFIASKVD
jgi:hypothetical protein